MRAILTACLVLVLASACDVGSVLPPGEDQLDATGGTGPDGGVAGGPDGATAACEPASANLPNGEHNPGQACLTCHDGNGAPRFTLAGTVYTAVQGGTPVAGSTIIVTDANAVVTKLITASNGNFYSNQTFAYPVQVSASKCPDTRPMVGAVQNTGGDCNLCHAVGQSGRIYLP